MSDELDLGNLIITITDGEPAEAKFDLPNGTSVTRAFPESGTINMRLGLGLSLSHQRPPAAEGGGGAPEWVPPDGTTPVSIHIDLVGGTPQARAWVTGTGEVAVDTLLGTDANTTSYWGPTEYAPARLTEFGYVNDPEGAGENDLAFIGVARTKIRAGSTLVITAGTHPDNPENVAFVAVAANAAAAISIGYNTNTLAASGASDTGSYAENLAGVVNYTPGIRVDNKIAITFTPTRAEFAVNGTKATDGVLTTTEYPTSGADEIVAFILRGQGNGIKSITIYDPLPTSADLAALSA